jgi:hypothetical protein
MDEARKERIEQKTKIEETKDKGPESRENSQSKDAKDKDKGKDKK